MFKRAVFLATFAVGGWALTGCAATADTDAESMALICPSCETVWVKERRLHSKPGVYSTRAKMRCPTCDTMAKAYFKDGEKILHNCPDCKVTPKVAKSHG